MGVGMLLDALHLWWRCGIAPGGVADVECSNNSRKHESKPIFVSQQFSIRTTHFCLPDERSEDNRGNTRRVYRSVVSTSMIHIAPVCGNSDPCSEPENHGQSFNADDSVLVCSSWESAGSEDEVGDG